MKVKTEQKYIQNYIENVQYIILKTIWEWKICFCIPNQFCIFCLRSKFSEVSILSCLHLDTHKCRYFFMNGYPIKFKIKSKLYLVTLIWCKTSQSKHIEIKTYIIADTTSDFDRLLSGQNHQETTFSSSSIAYQWSLYFEVSVNLWIFFKLWHDGTF